MLAEYWRAQSLNCTRDDNPTDILLTLIAMQNKNKNYVLQKTSKIRRNSCTRDCCLSVSYGAGTEGPLWDPLYITVHSIVLRGSRRTLNFATIRTNFCPIQYWWSESWNTTKLGRSSKEKSFRNPIISNPNQIVFTIFLWNSKWTLFVCGSKSFGAW